MPTSYVDPSGILYLGGGFVEPTNDPVPFPVEADFTQDGQISLSWDPQPGALFYRVWMGLAETCVPLVQDRLQNTSTTVSNLRGQTQYFFQVTAVLGPRESTASEIGSGIIAALPFCYTKLIVNQDFSGFTAEANNYDSFGYTQQITLDWTDTESSCGIVASYTLTGDELPPPHAAIQINLVNVQFDPNGNEDCRDVIINIDNGYPNVGSISISWALDGVFQETFGTWPVVGVSGSVHLSFGSATAGEPPVFAFVVSATPALQ